MVERNNIISEEEKWKAVINCDKTYDGVFYYGVKTTGIFCRPSCKAKSPLKKNTQFFDNSKEAIKSGYRPCKMCRPDLVESVYEPNRELIGGIKEIIDQNYMHDMDLRTIAREIGISPSHLTRLFKQHFGQTPNYYITQLRINKSKELLKSADNDILEISQEVGFKSLSTFYKCFKERAQMTPKEYRKKINKGE